MKDEITQERIHAVRRFIAGEKPESICTSVGRSRSWLYKWASRYDQTDDPWWKNRPKPDFFNTPCLLVLTVEFFSNGECSCRLRLK